jgi:hypothetical protein
MRPSTQPVTESPFVLNARARVAVLANAIEMTQPIYSQVINPAAQTVVNIPTRNVGLIKRFIVEVTATANNTGATLASLTDFGVANLLSQVTFTDLNNNTRIQTSGFHLAQVAAAKYQWPLGSVLLPSAESSDYGDFFAAIQAPATIANGASGTVRMFYEVPLAYSDDDLRGAVYANVINATMNLQLTINSTPFIATGADSTQGVYHNTATGTLTNVTITVYQVYLDQLPMAKNGAILPQMDLATVYELKNSVLTAIPVNQEYPIPYANFRDFLSTFVVFNHDASADAGRVGGTDVSYFALQSANFTNIWKKSPELIALETRKLLQTDFPKGVYYFSSRRKPVSTTTYGNMELVLNPSTAAASAYVIVGWEDFALTNALQSAGSLVS